MRDAFARRSSPRDVDQLEAAAAQVADDAVRRVEARDHAERRELAPRAAPESSSIGWPQAASARGAGRPRRSSASRAAAVASTKNCRRRASSGRARGSARAPRAPADRLLVEAPGRRDVAAEAAQHLLVEDRRRRAGEALIGDEAHRVRADIDDGDRAGRPCSRPCASRRLRGCSSALSAFREGLRGSTSSAICRGRTGSDWS